MIGLPCSKEITTIC